METERPDPGHEAAAWLTRRDRGFTAAEQDAFFEWLAASPAHGEALAQHQRTVSRLKVLAQWRPLHATRPNPDLLASPARRSGARRWALGAMAAAAGVAFLFLSQAPEVPVEAASPVIRKVLEDGSTIDLNQGAEVVVSYTPQSREVRLVRGEATFTVAKNPDRPFMVDARRVRVRAVGTAFNVNLQGGAVAVLVTEGRVTVSDARAPDAVEDAPRPDFAPVFLEAGQRTVVAREPPPVLVIDPVSAEEMGRILAWRPRQLEFNDTPLAQVVAEFNASNRVKLVVDDPGLASLPIGASLRSDNVEGFVRLLESSFGVEAERRSDHTIVLRPRRR